MGRFDRVVLDRIRVHYKEFTPIEKQIADYFLTNHEIENLSSKQIASKLYVSEASLSRFANKCEYKGFREFAYHYMGEVKALSVKPDMNSMTRKVLDQYQELLDFSFGLVDEQQMNRIAKLLSECRNTVVYGKGSSGIAAEEFALRFMRLGVHVHAITDTHIMKMNSALADESVLTIGISISGNTSDLLTALDIARDRGSKIILITANASRKSYANYDEILHVATIKHMEKGTGISPQFPILVMLDIFYSYFMNTDYYLRSSMYVETLTALFKGQEWNGEQYREKE